MSVTPRTGRPGAPPGAGRRGGRRIGRHPAGPAPRLIAAKLDAPRAPTKLVVRQRLMAHLDCGTSRQLTVVTGPAGAGKTALLTSWLAGDTFFGPAAWLTLDEDDNQPARLWAYLLAAVQRSAPVPAGHPITALAPPSIVDSTFLGSVVSAVETLPVPMVLVLDNVGCLRPGAAADSLGVLLRHPVPLVHLVLSGRELPPLPVGRLHMAGELTEVGPDDLAFTPDEAARLWRLRGRPTNAGEIADLVARTEGWAAGLHLAAQADEDGGSAVELLGAYLRDEVLAGRPPEVRDFLLRTCVVDALDGALAGELTGRRDGALLLDGLRRAHVFVHPTPAGFRYQRPFLDFLRHEAGTHLAAELPDLHRRAARWYARHADPVAAARHAAAAEDWGYAARLIVERAAPQLYGPRRAELCAVLDAVPAGDTERDPEVGAALALAAAVHGDASASRRHAAGVDDRLAGLPVERGAPVHAGLCLAALVTAYATDDPSTLDGAAARLAVLLDGPPSDHVPPAAALRTLAAVGSGLARLWAGDLAGADRLLAGAAAEAVPAGLDLAAAEALGGRAFVAALRGQLGTAADLAAAASRLDPRPAPDPGHDPCPGPDPRPGAAPGAGLARAVDALVRRLRGGPVDDDECLPALASAPPRLRLCSGGSGRALLDALVAIRRQRAEGDVRAARSALAGAVPPGGTPPPLLRDWLAVTGAELQVAEGRPGAALTMLAALPSHPHPLSGPAAVATAWAHLVAGSPARAVGGLAALDASGADLAFGTAVEARLVEALAADRLDHQGAVSIALAAALAAAVPEQLLEPFLSADGDLPALLARHRDLLAAHRPFTDRLTAALDAARSRRRTDRVVEPVTERESVVLRYLPTLLTMTEIARELCVSPNTVKSHLRSVYRKLGVGTRRDAVHRARALDLI